MNASVSQFTVAQTLQQVFGCDFTVEAQPATVLPSSAQNSTAGDSTSGETEITVSGTADTGWLLKIRNIDTTDGVVQACAVVRDTDETSVRRLAAVAIQLLEKERTIEGLNQELGYFIEQVSGGLEETAWFRRMAEQVAACRADEPLNVLCDRILPQLRSLLFARSVCVLKPANTAGGFEVIAEDHGGDDGNWVPKARRILSQNIAESGPGCIILNKAFPGQNLQSLPKGVDGSVLVRIGTPEQNFGWLVAVGRENGHGEAGQARSSETEFGTHEATLMESAAVLLATHAANCELFAEQEKTLIGVVTAMVNALDARDPYTRGHSHRVAMIGRRLAEEIGMSQEAIEDIYLTGLLHDIGKIGVPDDVLLKDGPLDPDERRQIEQHTVIGHAILKPVRQLQKVLPGVLHHHERMDGTGYPSRLAGADIPIAGRILAVADAFDAMTTSRPYRKAMPVVEAIQIMLEGVGRHWDEVVVDAFFRALGDIQRIYHEYNDGADLAARGESILQYGRFEDVSHGQLADLAAVGVVQEA